MKCLTKKVISVLGLSFAICTASLGTDLYINSFCKGECFDRNSKVEALSDSDIESLVRFKKTYDRCLIEGKTEKYAYIYADYISNGFDKSKAEENAKAYDNLIFYIKK